MNILKPTEKELKFQKKLREEALKEMHKEYDYINHQVFDIGHLAEKLDLYPSGVESLLAKAVWSMETGIRVCIALGLDVTLDVCEYRM